MRAVSQMLACINAPDAPFEADMVDCLDAVFDPKWQTRPRIQRAFVESLIEQAVSYGRRTASQGSRGT